MEKKIKLGVFGAGRGAYLAETAGNNGFELVAVCDEFKPLLEHTKKNLQGKKIAFYTDYDKFLEHDMDAVIVANYATEHAPAAIRALRAGKHVMSECMAMFTMGEAVELAEAVEESKKVYLLAENYPFNAQNLEMARLYASGEMGKFLYGEAEYIHPINGRGRAEICTGPDHWRAWLPVTYYCTHSMAPVMLITGTTPVRVNGFVVPHDFDDPINSDGNIKTDDAMSILMCTMDNGAVAKIMPCAKLRDHGNRVRICCNRGTMEYTQGFEGILRVRRHPELDKWENNPPSNTYYHPAFPQEFTSAGNFGHGGGDFFTSYYFAEAIRGHIEPKIDVYKAIAMSSIGILGFKSALQKGVPFEIPDFHDKKAREIFRNDDWNPNPARHREGMPYSSILGKLEVPEKDMELFKKYRAEYEKNL